MQTDGRHYHFRLNYWNNLNSDQLRKAWLLKRSGMKKGTWYWARNVNIRQASTRTDFLFCFMVNLLSTAATIHSGIEYSANDLVEFFDLAMEWMIKQTVSLANCDIDVFFSHCWVTSEMNDGGPGWARCNYGMARERERISEWAMVVSRSSESCCIQRRATPPFKLMFAISDGQPDSDCNCAIITRYIIRVISAHGSTRAVAEPFVHHLSCRICHFAL